MQQAGRSGRAGEISDPIIVLPSSGSGRRRSRFPAPRSELISAYSVEAEDEAALMEFLESGSCRRAILARYLDGHLEATSCLATDSILCDRCLPSLEPSEDDDCHGRGNSSDRGCGSRSPDGADDIHQALGAQVGQEEQLEEFYLRLHAHCIYCQLMLPEGEGEPHVHRHCHRATAANCGLDVYEEWRFQLEFAPHYQCYRCGLSQSICHAIEDERPCQFPHLILPGFFFLQKAEMLIDICRQVGFSGDEQWQWQ